MGLRCNCQATVTGTGEVATLINRFPSTGLVTVTAVICPNCSPTSSSITINYVDNQNVANNFTFTSSTVNLPLCAPVVGGGEAMLVSAEGEAVGVTFNGAATLTSIQFLEQTIVGTVTCSIDLTANANRFEVQGCFNSNVEITNC